MRTIDADALMEKVREIWTTNWPLKNAMLNAIHNAPTIDPVKHGRWKGKPISGFTTVRCSICGALFLENSGGWNYCPLCGSKMDEEKSDESNRTMRVREG